MDQFGRHRTRGHQTYCLECTRLKDNAAYAERRTPYLANKSNHDKSITDRNNGLILGYLRNHSCVDCGESDPIVLDFDHVRGDKKNNIAAMLRTAYEQTLLDEIAKCDVRCANCHRRKTAKERRTFRYTNTIGV